MTPDYTDAPPEIAQAIKQSTIIKEPHMPQPEITFRHGLCSASIWEQEFHTRRHKAEGSKRQFSAQLFGQRRQLATDKFPQGERYSESNTCASESVRISHLEQLC